MAQAAHGGIAVSAAGTTSIALKGAEVGGIQSTIDVDYGCDVQLTVTVYTDSTETAIHEITGWALSFMVKDDLSDADAQAVLTKTTAAGIVISGSFHVNPTSNTQRATVTLTAANTTIPQRVYWWELKRTDSGSETRLAHGLLAVGQTVHLT
jgi:hypothetical protein